MNILYFYESYWRNNKKENDRDSFGKLFPFPKENIKKWSGQDQFLEQLKNKEKNYKLNESNRNKNCLLCNKKNINNGKYNDNEFIWEDGLKHYIEIHNIKPTDDFIEFIYLYNPITNKNQLNKRIIKFNSDIYVVHDIRHIKITEIKL